MAAEDIALSQTEQDALDRLWGVAQDGDHYAMLDVPDTAERGDIQKAYHTLSRQWHPDRFFRQNLGDYAERLEAVFIAITDAYRTLSNASARRAYDVERESNPRRRRRRATRAASSSGPVSEATQEALDRDAERVPRRSSLREGRAAGRRRRSSRPEGSTSASARAPSEASSRPRRAPAMSKTMAEMRKRLRRQLKRAKELYAEGQKHMEAGAVMKATSAFTMALSFDPKNDTYKKAAEGAQRAARKLQAKNYVQLAESAESFANLREALANYQKACEYEVDEARPYYRLGVLLRRIEDDHRAALDHFRTAVQKDPKNVEFRLALGELYAELGLKVNAQGQFKRVLALDKGNDKAKAGLKAL